MIPGTSHSLLLLSGGLLRPASPLVGGKPKGIGAVDSVTLGPQMPLTPPVCPSTFWSLACPAFQCPAEGPGSGFLILVARRLPSPVAVSKGCWRDKSVPHPGLVTFPGPARLGSQRGKDSGSEMACDPGVDLPCSQVILPAGPVSHSGGRSRMAFSSPDKMEASSESQCPPNSLFQTKSYDVERGFCVMLGHPWKSLRGKFQNFAKASSEKPVPLLS